MKIKNAGYSNDTWDTEVPETIDEVKLVLYREPGTYTTETRISVGDKALPFEIVNVWGLREITGDDFSPTLLLVKFPLKWGDAKCFCMAVYHCKDYKQLELLNVFYGVNNNAIKAREDFEEFLDTIKNG